MNRVFGIIAGLASVLGFSLSIILLYNSIRSNIETEFKEIIFAQSIALITLLITVIVIFRFFLRESEKLIELPSENFNLKSLLKKHEILAFNSAQYFHNISHYYRNLICEFEDFNGEDENLELILIQFDQFLNTLTSNLHSYFTLLTGDNCAVTIKITKYDDKNISKIRTLYRDPISYRKRKKSDSTPQGTCTIYSVGENTSFNIISSPIWKNTTFLCDDLRAKWEKGEYQNKTQGWMNLYNACAVVPINRRLNGINRKILGFICIDNFAGNLANPLVENFLCGIADMLYNLFKKYEQFANLANEKEIYNERAKAFTDWNNS